MGGAVEGPGTYALDVVVAVVHVGQFGQVDGDKNTGQVVVRNVELRQVGEIGEGAGQDLDVVVRQIHFVEAGHVDGDKNAGQVVVRHVELRQVGQIIKGPTLNCMHIVALQVDRVQVWQIGEGAGHEGLDVVVREVNRLHQLCPP